MSELSVAGVAVGMTVGVGLLGRGMSPLGETWALVVGAFLVGYVTSIIYRRACDE